MTAMNWLPRQGAPTNVWDRFSQTCIKVLAITPVYIALVVTIILLMQIFGVPFVEGR